MTKGQKKKDPNTAARRLRRRRRRWLFLALSAALLIAFYCFVTFRGSRDYTGEFARLLPARTSAFAALSDFGGIREHVAQTRLYAELRESVDVAALLLTSEDWRKLQKNKDSVEGKAKAALAREFLRRYFSQQVALALAWLDGCDEPALLVMARTDLGFTEKLAELCAELYPDLKLKTLKYRGIRFYVYEGDKPKRSFSFVRFGKTVVLSLRSNERDYLRRIIDYRLDSPAETLFETEDFKRARKSPARRRGLLAIIRPEAFVHDLTARPDFSVRRFFSSPGGKRLRQTLSQVRSSQIALTAVDSIELRTVLRLDEASTLIALSDPPRKPLSLLHTVPSDCLAFVDFRFGDPAQCLARVLNIQRAFTDEANDPEALSRAVGRLNAAWGIDIDRDLGPALADESALVLHAVTLQTPVGASLLIPATDPIRAESVIGRVVRKYADFYANPENARQLPESFRQAPGLQPLYPTPLGFLGLGRIGDYYAWTLNPGPFLAVRNRVAGKGKAIQANPVFKRLQLPVGDPLDVLAFVNLEEVGGRAEGVLAVLALTSKSVRERWAKYSKIVSVARMLGGVGLYARHAGTEWTVALKVPLQ